MPKVYRGSDGDITPVEMECEVFGYPNHTKCGEQMCENTHFATREEAWASIKRSAIAEIRLTSDALESVENQLMEARHRSAKAATRLSRVVEAMQKEDLYV